MESLTGPPTQPRLMETIITHSHSVCTIRASLSEGGTLSRTQTHTNTQLICVPYSLAFLTCLASYWTRCSHDCAGEARCCSVWLPLLFWALRNTRGHFHWDESETVPLAGLTQISPLSLLFCSAAFSFSSFLIWKKKLSYEAANVAQEKVFLKRK